MRIAVFQGPAESGTVRENLDRLEQRAHEAAGKGARLLICPEMFLTGYAIGAEKAWRLAEPAGGPSAERAARIARQAGIALLYGYPEESPAGPPYNAALLLGRDGRRLMSYRKSHLFGDLDRGMFLPGGEPPAPAELDGLKVGALICYDVEFPENVRRWALAGADLVAVPTALMAPYTFVTRNLVAARAYENQLFLAYANRCDREGELDYLGQSCVIAPDGGELARAGRGEELLLADLDMERAQSSRRLNTYLADRRPELYRRLVETGDSAGRTP
jgi:predicted amidohydrolase